MYYARRVVCTARNSIATTTAGMKHTTLNHISALSTAALLAVQASFRSLDCIILFQLPFQRSPQSDAKPDDKDERLLLL